MDRGFAETGNGRILAGMARNCRMIFFTGLPASGKSFFLRALISMAGTAGRRVHLMRWDAGLASFQTDEILARYPDVADGSHPIVRMAAGLWGRKAVARWRDMHPDHAELLVGEVPIVGNRFSELVKVLPDAVEAALASQKTAFVYPVPTSEMRAKLEALRRETFANPRHPDEAKDAPPATMELAWRLTCAKSIELGLVQAAEGETTPAYDAALYRRFFDRLLRHRNARALDVDMFYASSGSAHNIQGGVSEIFATPGEVEEAIAAIEAVMDPDAAARAVENWYRM
ncbi:hypothetical protein GV827_22330 [Sulfitobacter sp. JBTF-M27]|uniref:Uncharacterized protein n=1 Tax=Sulfitobacter sediminilitoris TaxID=2698830 RepID=A0A6P0CGP3_9RHOB|nr:hypothetical protein [Sulfitobacter sediminilitoris]NEK25107.1 hypothetical protein [Sulfitobacter sediminilitoris]